MIANKKIKSAMIIKTWNMDGNALTKESTSIVSPSNLLRSLNGLSALNDLSALKLESEIELVPSRLPAFGLIVIYQSARLTITIRKSIWLLNDMNYASS